MEAAVDGTGLHKMFSGGFGAWTPDGRFFIFQNKVSGRFDLWAMAEEKGSRWRKQDDKPTQLTAGPLDFETPMPSKDGKEIFAIGSAHRAEVIRFDSHTGDFVPFLHGISAKDLAFSMDGEWVCYTSVPEGTLWRSRVDGSEQLQLTFPPMQVLLPRWSPDGKQIAFSAILPEGNWNIYVIPSTGGSAQRIMPSDQSQIDAGWSPDGNSLVFGSVWVPNAPISIIELKSKRLSTLPGSNGLFSPHWSPDGRYMSGTVSSAALNLMLFDFSTQKWTKVADLSAGYPNWSRDGKYLYFKSFDSWDFPFDIVRLRLRDRKIEKLADSRNIGRLTAGSWASWLGLAPDDSPLLARDISTQEIYALEMEWP
jgi:Tol biopolymer transport system component